MNLIYSEYPGVFGIEHIVFLIISLILMFVSWFLIAKYAKSEKAKNIVLKIVATCLLVCIIWNRLSITIYNFNHNDLGLHNLFYLIPLSFCGMSSLLTGLTILLMKKDNKLMHYIFYLGFIGGLVSMFYPDYLEEQMFLDPRTLSGLLHHTLLVFAIVCAIITGWFKPDLKKWYIFPIGFCITMTFGMAMKEISGLGAMQIQNPLIKSLPILTSWYIVGLAEWLYQFIVMVLFAKFKDKKSFKEIFNMKKDSSI